MAAGLPVSGDAFDGFAEGTGEAAPGFAWEAGTQPGFKSSIFTPPGGSWVGSSQPAGRSDFLPSGVMCGAVIFGAGLYALFGAAGAADD